MPALNKLYQQYRNQVAFLVVYITEAHPTDVWQTEINVRDKVLVASPRSEEERGFVAGACVRKLGIEIPAVLDEFGNSTESAYTAWPERLYLIDGHGKVAYKSKPGPFGFKPDALQTALTRVVGASLTAESDFATGVMKRDSRGGVPGNEAADFLLFAAVSVAAP